MRDFFPAFAGLFAPGIAHVKLRHGLESGPRSPYFDNLQHTEVSQLVSPSWRGLSRQHRRALALSQDEKLK